MVGPPEISEEFVCKLQLLGCHLWLDKKHDKYRVFRGGRLLTIHIEQRSRSHRMFELHEVDRMIAAIIDADTEQKTFIWTK